MLADQKGMGMTTDVQIAIWHKVIMLLVLILIILNLISCSAKDPKKETIFKTTSNLPIAVYKIDKTIEVEYKSQQCIAGQTITKTESIVLPRHIICTKEEPILGIIPNFDSAYFGLLSGNLLGLTD